GWKLRGEHALLSNLDKLRQQIAAAKEPEKKLQLQVQLIEAVGRHQDFTKRSNWSVAGAVRVNEKIPRLLEADKGTGILLNGDNGRGVDLLSDLQHGDCELHIEFNVPRGSNSGVYFQGQYEVQILDSFGKKDKDLKFGDCGGIYNHAPPRTNASKPPG